MRTSSTPISFLAEDGYRLHGSLYRDDVLTNPPPRVALINAGAGIPATYYGRFAADIASAGVPALTYDYRGVGQSSPASLRGFRASVEDWGSKDCAAAIRALGELYPTASIAVIGHSIGCFLTGFVTWQPPIDRLLFVAPHTGYYGDYARTWRLPMWFMWHFLMPVVTECVGYFPGALVRFPDLPKGVALEWANRRKPQFWWNLYSEAGVPDVERRDALLRRFASFRGAGLAVRASDDAFSTIVGCRRATGLFSGLDWSERMIVPGEVGGVRIGHFGYFSRVARAKVWQIAIDWLRSSSVGTGSGGL